MRSIEVEHEVDAQAANVVEHLEAPPAGSPRVEVDDELVDHLLERGEVPSPILHQLGLRLGQSLAPLAVAAGEGFALACRPEAPPPGRRGANLRSSR